MEKSSQIQIRSLLILGTLILSFHLNAQSRHITLIIDTLSMGQETHFPISISKQGFAGIEEQIKSSKIRLNKKQYPNLVCQLEIKVKDAEILIPLDTRDGKLILKHPYQMKSDTIRISRHSILINCLPRVTINTVNQYQYYYEKGIEVKLGDPKKTDNERIVHEERCHFEPKPPSFLINRKKVELELKTIEIAGGVTVYHGYKPKSFEKNRDKFKGNVTYFHGMTKEFSSNYQAHLNLKNY
jgi:hypothetical protein